MAHDQDDTRPPSRAEMADKCSLIRQLITIADQQIDRAKTDLSVARVGLAELEQQLLTGEVQP
jgi:hypothetical protein